MFQGIVTAFGTLLVVIVILYLTYICTKYIGKTMGVKGMRGNSRYIKMLDQIVLGQESSIALIKISERVLLIGITSGQVTVLTEVEENELIPLPFPETEGGSSMDFKDIIERLKDRKK